MLPGIAAGLLRRARSTARVPGYVKAWYKDIGAQVKKGDLSSPPLIHPELDQQISPGAGRSGRRACRREQLVRHHGAALEQPAAAGCRVQAGCRGEKPGSGRQGRCGQGGAGKSGPHELAMKGFSRSIVAPFDGVVTKPHRRYRRSWSMPGQPPAAIRLFTVADMHALRVYVDVPQILFRPDRAGHEAFRSAVPEYPGRSFSRETGSRTSNAIGARNARACRWNSRPTISARACLSPGAFAQVSA